MSIFLSYASENREIAELIAFAMRARGHEVFLDKDDLPAGKSYEEKIGNAIQNSDLFIFLISRKSIETGRYTLTEVSLARKKWKNPQNHILPVMVEPVDIKKIPVYLRSVSILQPSGDPAAEVCAEAAQIINLNRLPYATFPRRVFSVGIDLIFLFLFLFGISYNILTEVPHEASNSGLTLAINLVSFSAIVGFYVVSLMHISGTPGDRFFKLKIIDEENGKKPTTMQAFIWTLSYVPLFYISWIWYFFDEKKRMLHNVASGTIVVSEAKDDKLEQLSSSAFDVIKGKIKTGNFEGELKKFQNFLDEKKPDRNTHLHGYKPSQNNLPSNSSVWHLSGADSEGAQLRFSLNTSSGNKKTWVLGRQAGECDFQIDQTKISRKHAEIRFDPAKGLAIRDLTSTNGTYLNGKKISENWNLMAVNDQITIGSTKLLLSNK